MSRKTLRTLAVGWLVVVVGAFALVTAAVMFTAPSLGYESPENSPVTGRPAPYRWNGEPLILSSRNSGEQRYPNCVVTPDNGEERSINLWGHSRRWVFRGAELEPWFSGAATIRCNVNASVYTGTHYTIYKAVSSRPFTVGVVIVGVAPFAALVLTNSRQKQPR